MVDLTGPTADESQRALTRAVAAGAVEHLVVGG